MVTRHDNLAKFIQRFIFTLRSTKIVFLFLSNRVATISHKLKTYMLLENKKYIEIYFKVSLTKKKKRKEKNGRKIIFLFLNKRRVTPMLFNHFRFCGGKLSIRKDFSIRLENLLLYYYYTFYFLIILYRYAPLFTILYIHAPNVFMETFSCND